MKRERAWVLSGRLKKEGKVPTGEGSLTSPRPARQREGQRC